MDILIEILQAALFGGAMFLSIIFFMIGWKVMKTPNDVWERNRRKILKQRVDNRAMVKFLNEQNNRRV